MNKIKTKIPSTLNILSSNANSLCNKKLELEQFLSTHCIDIALVQETHFKPSTTANIQNYKLYRNDRTTHKGGGTAIYVKCNLRHYELPNLDLYNRNRS